MQSKEIGLLITIEGGEGSGKSTLVKKLFKFLDSLYPKRIIKTFEPGGTIFGEKIRDLLLKDESFKLSDKSELFLFLADRAQHIQTLIRPALESGKIVICDRFTDSSIAYQGAARLKSGIKEIKEICNFATDNLVADITFYLDLDPEAGLLRVKGALDRLEKETIEFHKAVRGGFLQLAKECKERFCVIDASQSPEDVFSDVQKHLDQRLNSYV